jgi:hypothetical protein
MCPSLNLPRYEDILCLAKYHNKYTMYLVTHSDKVTFLRISLQSSFLQCMWSLWKEVVLECCYHCYVFM